ncbi:MAG: hypothetical protein ACJ764_13995 [Solirubrobacteraceae bacterium]
MRLPRPGALVYGTITVGALLAAESADRETYAETILAVAVALVVYWLAHAYSDLTEHRLAHNQPLTLRGLGQTLARESMIVAGAAVPMLVLVIYGITGAHLTDAVNAAIWTSAGMIVAIEVLSGLRAHLSGPQLLVQAAMGTLCGLLVITLKLILH